MASCLAQKASFFPKTAISYFFSMKQKAVVFNRCKLPNLVSSMLHITKYYANPPKSYAFFAVLLGSN